MPRKPINFELDFMIKYIFPRFTVKQFDDVSFNIKPLNQGLDYDTTGMIGKIFVGVNNDMFMQTTNIAVSSNNINVLLDKNMLQKSGRAYAEIELTDKAGTITSSSFIFDIDPKIGEGGMIPGEYEGFVEKYERLIAEFKSQVNSSVNSANSLVNDVIKKCNTNVDNKLNTVDGLINAKISDIEKRFNNITASKQQDAEVVTARDGEVSLHARLERDLANTNRELEKIKKLEESTVSTVTSDKAFTTVAETSNGYFEDVKIEGKTLVNLAGSVNDYFNQFDVISRTCMLLKCNTEYTAVISNKADHLVRVYCNEKNMLTAPTFDIHPRTTIIKKLCTKDVVDGTGLFKSNSATGTLFKLDILLLEGDHTDKDITFFEGLKSVGQDSDGIKILSQSKNLVNNIVNEWEVGSIDGVNGTNTTATTRIRMKNFETLPKKEGYLSCKYFGDYKLAIRFYNKKFEYISGQDNPYQGFIEVPKIEIPNGAFYYKLVCASKSGNEIVPSEISNCMCQLELGETTPVSYTSYGLNKKEILYFNPTTETWEKPVLREWDSIEKHSDKYYYHKRSGEVILNGSENWQLPVGERWNNKTLTCSFMLKIDGAKGSSWGKYIPRELSSKFLNYGNIELYDSDIEGFTTDNLHGDRIFRILKSKLSTQDVEGFKQWLQANNVTVVYQLAQEEIYECTNLDLITYSGETNLIVNSGAIQPKITLKVLSNVSNVVKLLQEKVSILENKFITGLKQVLAGDMMSLAYLLYPQDFDKDNEVKTLEEL